jgi:hypothetical protein
VVGGLFGEEVDGGAHDIFQESFGEVSGMDLGEDLIGSDWLNQVVTLLPE